jgi:hypothetical protein
MSFERGNDDMSPRLDREGERESTSAPVAAGMVLGHTYPVSGRFEQLARQIRRLRTTASEPTRTLKRAVHLAVDIARERADGLSGDEPAGGGPAAGGDGSVGANANGSDGAGDHDAEHAIAFGALADQGLLDRAVAERLAALAADTSAVTDQHIVDLDVFLRSVENGAPAQPLPLAPLHGSPKPPPGTHRASVNVSGRVVTVEGRDGTAIVTVDDRLIAGAFALDSVPLSHYDVTRTPDGTVTIEWPALLRVTVAPDFASAQAEVLGR